MRGVSFLTHFPVPRYMLMEGAGLSISQEGVYLIDLSEKRQTRHLNTFFGEDFEKPVIEKGKIVDRPRLRDTLIQSLSHTKKNFFHVFIPEDDAFIFTLRLPLTDIKEMREVVELELEEHIPLAPEDVYFDYDEFFILKNKGECVVHVVVLERDIIDSYVSLFDEIGARSAILGVNAQAAAYAMIPASQRDGTFLMVDFGRMRTSISVVARGHVAFNSTIDLGGKDITAAIIKEYGVSAQEARKLEKEKGITSRVGEKDLFSCVFPVLAVLRDEIQKYNSYWQSRLKKEGDVYRPIEKIYFCGSALHLKGFSSFWSSYLNDLPFEVMNPWENVFSLKDIVPPLHRIESFKYAPAIGAALFQKIIAL